MNDTSTPAYRQAGSPSSLEGEGREGEAQGEKGRSVG